MRGCRAASGLAFAVWLCFAAPALAVTFEGSAIYDHSIKVKFRVRGPGVETDGPKKGQFKPGAYVDYGWAFKARFQCYGRSWSRTTYPGTYGRRDETFYRSGKRRRARIKPASWNRRRGFFELKYVSRSAYFPGFFEYREFSGWVWRNKKGNFQASGWYRFARSEAPFQSYGDPHCGNPLAADGGDPEAEDDLISPLPPVRGSIPDEPTAYNPSVSWKATLPPGKRP